MKLLKIGLLLLGLIIIYLFAVREKAPSAITPSPAPIVVIPTIGLAPTSQRLIINWNSLTFGTPEKLPFFTITAPLIDSQSISVIAATLGFSDNDLKPSLKTTSRFYVKNNLSLFASTVQNQVLFNAITPLPTKQGFASPAVLQQKAETYLRQFFTGQTFIKTTTTEYFFADNSSETYPETASQSRANLIRLSYRQELNGYPLLTTSAKNAIVSFTFDSNQILRSLEISGGFNTTEAGSQLALLDFNALKIQGPRLAVLLSLETTVDNKSLIDNQLSVTLDLDSLELIYFAKPDDRQIIPVFLLSGILKGSFPDTPATYLVPAARP